jgi:thiamine-phosphate pyrophosphorylase
MTSRPPKAPERPAPRLYLVTPLIGETAAFGDALRDILGAADIAAVLLRLAPADERTQINRAKTLAKIVQERDVALILDGHPELVARAGADGAHLTGLDAFDSAAGRLKPDRIAGAGGFETRHEAMLAAERGADYILFGEPDADGHRPSLASVCERVNWWSDVFEIPCIAYAGDLQDIPALVAAGADFVAIGGSVFSDPRGPRAMAQAAHLAAQAARAAEVLP